MSGRVEKIGDATLYLGDAREVLKMLGKVDCVVSDPPFGMQYRSGHRAQRHDAIEGDAGADLLRWACELTAAHSKYIFCRWDNLRDVPPPKSAITWVKNNWTSGDLEHAHARQTELILFYPGEGHFFPTGRPADVISCPKVSSDRHPTEKPTQLMERIVEWTEGVVVDPFMGSGTTGAACVALNRPFVGVEIHEPYFDIACRRIEEAYRQPRLFAEPKAKPKQEALEL